MCTILWQVMIKSAHVYVVEALLEMPSKSGSPVRAIRLRSWCSQYSRSWGTVYPPPPARGHIQLVTVRQQTSTEQYTYCGPSSFTKTKHVHVKSQGLFFFFFFGEGLQNQLYAYYTLRSLSILTAKEYQSKML